MFSVQKHFTAQVKKGGQSSQRRYINTWAESKSLDSKPFKIVQAKHTNIQKQSQTGKTLILVYHFPKTKTLQKKKKRSKSQGSEMKNTRTRTNTERYHQKVVTLCF